MVKGIHSERTHDWGRNMNDKLVIMSILETRIHLFGIKASHTKDGIGAKRLILLIIHIQWSQLGGRVKGTLILLPEEISCSSSFYACDEIIVSYRSSRAALSASSMSSPISNGWKTAILLAAGFGLLAVYQLHVNLVVGFAYHNLGNQSIFLRCSIFFYIVTNNF
jgi:hypothetical protein